MNKKDYKDLIKMRSERYTTCNNLLYYSNGAFTQYSTMSGSTHLFLYKGKVAYLRVNSFVFWGTPNRTVTDTDIALISNMMMYAYSPVSNYRVGKINPERLKEDSQNFFTNMLKSLLNKVKPKDIGDFIKDKRGLISAYNVFDFRYNYMNENGIISEIFPDIYKKYSDFLESEALKRREKEKKESLKADKERKRKELQYIREFYRNPLDANKLWAVSCGYYPVANVDGRIVSILYNEGPLASSIYEALKIMKLNKIKECSLSNIGRLSIKGRMAILAKRRVKDVKYRLCDFGL